MSATFTKAIGEAIVCSISQEHAERIHPHRGPKKITAKGPSISVVFNVEDNEIITLGQSVMIEASYHYKE